MRIGIDISQMAYEGTGVGEMVGSLVEGLLKIDSKNQYILFFSSLRRNFQFSLRPRSGRAIFNFQSNDNVTIKQFKLPPVLLDILWNRLHVLPIEWLIGEVDVFISSDWTQPPTVRAKKATIIYDLIVYKHPQETAKVIVETQKRRLEWVKKECDAVFCISEATKRDAMNLLEIDERKLKVIYPGV